MGWEWPSNIDSVKIITDYNAKCIKCGKEKLFPHIKDKFFMLLSKEELKELGYEDSHDYIKHCLDEWGWTDDEDGNFICDDCKKLMES